jgi:hypothetical protein
MKRLLAVRPPMNKLAMAAANRPRIIVESTRPYNMQSRE